MLHVNLHEESEENIINNNSITALNRFYSHNYLHNNYQSTVDKRVLKKQNAICNTSWKLEKS